MVLCKPQAIISLLHVIQSLEDADIFFFALTARHNNTLGFDGSKRSTITDPPFSFAHSILTTAHGLYVTQSCWFSCTSVDSCVTTTSTGAYIGESPPCWEARRYVTLWFYILYLRHFFPCHVLCSSQPSSSTENHIEPTMEFFTWCMAYPCPYGPCNPAEVDEWKKECEAIHEKRRQKKESKRAAKCKAFGPPTRPPPKYSALPCRLSRYSLSCPICRLRDLKSILRQWVVQQRKPYSAVSVQIDRMTSEQFEEDDLSGIIDLVEVIRIQSSGPTEAARAIRKKL